MTASHQVALVAGASRGLGLLVAKELLSRDFDVAVCARDATELARAREMLSPFGTVHDYVCDVAEADQVEALVRDVERDLGPVDVLITVAGIIQVGSVEGVTVEQFRDAVTTMTMGPVHTALAVLPGMRERGRGRIGTIASVGGLVSVPHLLPYCTAKFGAVGFSEGLAASLSGTGVTATSIDPGLMRTGSHERAYFTGESQNEYAWFAPSASLPVLSMNADRAARLIVDGVLAGRPIVLLGWLPKVAQRVRGIAPGLTIRALGVVNRVLPSASPQQTDLVVGATAKQRLGSRVVNALSTLGSKAAQRNNER
ncbi:SDR family NAD(P)-dependent oxidoreductase [Kocuria marina]|uniref:SDR family NAD(P)-dependent oxidoreductase n=1 Tax=Kocuria marina TaxID=223184 RepID=UPI0019D07BA0|nr:SDR family oxidoreductase [Kocuria indica]MBN6811224.1 SDR family oxidoreductase [Kocuria indica]MBN6842879.1 SDR family oxidoreductase [Kocuria indica]